MLTTKQRLIALAGALALFIAVVIAVNYFIPRPYLASLSGHNYGYVYSGAKSESIEFANASLQPDDTLLFGSSELSTPPSLIPEVPAVVFGQNAYGVNLYCIGEAYDQSLWHALAAGAYGQILQNKKVIIITSPSWFFDGGIDNSLFQTRFSYPLYSAFMDNDALSNASKSYVSRRLFEQGIEEQVVRAGAKEDVLAKINDAFFTRSSELHLRQELLDISQTGINRESFTGKKASIPNFEQWREHALEDARSFSSNEWGFDDTFYAENVGEYKDQIAGKLFEETFSDTPEYDDFGLFLRVCEEQGLEPLVVLSPLSGDYYDWVGIDSTTRRACYDHILEICEAYGVEVADFSDKEYEKYFLHDQVHFGWTGWVDVEEAIYAFVKENDDV